MKNFIKFSFMILILSGGIKGFSQQASSSSEDEKKVRAAILDYVEGVYEVDTTRIYKSVHPTIAKRGASYDKAKKSYHPFRDMNFEQLVHLTKTWNKDGKNANSTSVRDITIYEVQDKTATAKVVAAWGTDYFHLAKIDEKWYIMNVLWQSQKPNNLQ